MSLDVNGDVLFTPDADFNGVATFDYTAADGNGGTSSATVTVAVASVNDDPVAFADNAAATEDVAETILASALLSNDTDADGDTLNLASVQSAMNGTVSLDVNGDVLFTPDADFNGDATFEYTVDDGNGGTSSATVTVAVASVNDDPVAVADNEGTTEDVPVTILASGLLSNDTDVDGDPLSLASVQNAVNGTVSLDVNGDVVFTPDADFNGNATFEYTVDDGNGGTSSATVTVDVTAVNDDPVAVVDSAVAVEDVPVTILASALLSNDTDADGDTLSLTSVQNAVNGTVSLDVNGDVVFTPDAGFNGDATFEYTVYDENGATSSATVTVAVAAANAGETLIGGSGKDTLIGGDGDDTLIGNGGNDLLLGNGGNDVFVYSGTTGQGTVSGGEGFDRIAGSDGDDVIGLRVYSGTNVVEEIDGGSGVNMIQGHSGANVLDFSGTVLLNIDTIDGGGGADTITGSSLSDTIVGGAGNDKLFGGLGDDVFLVSGTNNAHDTVSGGGGFDRIAGSDGDDIIGLRVYSGVNIVEEIDGGLGVNVIEGYAGASVLDFSGTVLLNIDTIDGGGGADTIIGSSGDDTIIGGTGNDLLSGGTGNDRFIFSDNDGTDTIQDFASGAGSDDTIDFAAVTAIGDFAAIQASAADNGADTTIQYDGGSVTLIGVQVATLHEDDFIF